MVRVVELDVVTVNEANGCVGTECGDRKLFQEISPNLMVCALLLFGLIGWRLCEHPFGSLVTGTTQSQPVIYLQCLLT